MPRGILTRATAWPSELVLVRHGQSIGNLADQKAREAKALRLDLELRDADVPLSDAGREQAEAVGRYLAKLPDAEAPDVVVSSPYRRAAETAERANGAWGGDVDLLFDERLRERDLGVFDGLTGYGIREEYAQEAARRDLIGKFYYVPPSGESWCDVSLRVRSILRDLEGWEGQRLWLFTHQAVIMSFRYVLENLTEPELLDIDREEPLPNCSMTRYVEKDGRLRLDHFADTSAVDAAATPATDEPSKTERAGDVH
ncbi:MAG: histidine phosphatase family protein [Intrasporangium sp.]|uniref:histidine phosphatase family protein n=1 Tax=Intrasporangium sp. TaxID=1925024 RepID=UPI003F7E99B8